MTHNQDDYKPTPTLIKGSMDYTIYLVVIILTLIGIIMVLSASYLRAANFFDDSFYFFKRNVVWAVLGFVAMNLLARTPYKIIQRFAPIIYAVAVFFLGLVLIYGFAVGGAARWLAIPVIGQFQPSEVSKAALIFFLAWVIHRNPKAAESLSGFLWCCAYVGIIVALVAPTGMSNSLIVAFIGFGMIFVASPHIWRFVAMGIAAVSGLVAYLWWSALNDMDFRGNRFTAWLDPFDDPMDTGFQIVQSLYAIGSGGLFGLGIGQSRQKSFLPEAHNDIIFAIISEELGLIGAVTILLLFGILIWRGIKVALGALDTFSAMTAMGIVLTIAGQVIINVAVATNSIPNTGVTMPFISYGGTSLLVCMALMGVLLNISSYSKEVI